MVKCVRHTAWALWSIGFLAGSLHAQSVSMELDTSTIAIGQPVVLRILADRDISAGAGTFTWPAFQDSLPGGLEILKTGRMDTVAFAAEDGTSLIRVQHSLLVTAWDSGYRAIPPVALVWNQTDTLLTNPLLLEVLLSPPGEPGKIAAPADIRRVQWSWKERLLAVLPWILGGLALLGLGLWLFKKWRARPVVPTELKPKPVPAEPAHIVALRDLERIREAAIWKQGRVKAHHAEVSEVIRTYFERRYRYPALERSTDEIRMGLTHLPIRREEQELILEILTLTDLVKFAKWTPLQDDHYRVIEQATRFVERTTIETSQSELP